MSRRHGSSRARLPLAWLLALVSTCGPAAWGAETGRRGGDAPAAGEMQLDPVSTTEDAGKPRGDYSSVRVGQNSNCALRGASTDTYIKEAAERFPGPWGWMTMCRAGGPDDDINRALLYFDLSSIPKDASIREARLHLTLTPYTNAQAADRRFGAWLLRLPDAPGWEAAAATSAERRAAVAWPGGGLTAASNGVPLAIGNVVTRPDRNRRIPGAIEFDLTGAVRAWVQGKVANCGIVIDNRLEGGAFDFYSCRSFQPERRPYLEIALSPAIEKKPEPIRVNPAPPPGDYWVEPMRAVHARFKGRRGTLAQYGDSITVTMAFLAGFSYGKEIAPKNCPPEVKKEMDAVAAYSDRNLWRDWKGGQWGNTGSMMSDWLLAHVDEWQKKMNPEVAVILFGTNDLGRIMPPQYTENMAASLRRMLADGTVPILTTVPPKSGRDEMVYDYWLAGLSIAHGLNVPVIDYYSEIVRRRPDDWDGRLEKFSEYKGYDVPTLISRDGTHPSNPRRYVDEFSPEALNANGYGLRNYLTLRKYYEVIANVLQPK